MRLLIYFLLVIGLMYSCSMTRYIKEDEHMLKRVKIIHNTSDKKIDLKESLVQTNNASIVKKVLYVIAPKKYKEKWGKGPVVFDTLRVNESKSNINTSLKREGYLNNTVEAFHEIKHRKVTQTFVVNYNKQYKVNTLMFICNQPELKAIINRKKKLLHTKENSAFSFNNLKLDRILIANMFREQGYFNFKQDFIKFELDSSETKQSIDITCIIELIKSSEKKLEQHKKYAINNITISESNKSIIGKSRSKVLNNHFFSINVSNHYFPYTFSLLKNSIDLRKDSLIKPSKIKSTYKKLYSLGVFNVVEIKDQIVDSLNNKIDLDIMLKSKDKKQISLSTIGKYTEGNTGIESEISLVNNNLLGSAERLSLSIFAGFDFLSSNILNNNSNNNSLGGGIFSSFEIGPRLKLEIPLKLFPFRLKNFEEKDRLSSVFETYYSIIQRRDQFERRLSTISWTYLIKSRSNKTSYSITPVNINYVDISLTESFNKEILNRDNPVITNSYSDNFFISSFFSLKTDLSRNKENKNSIGFNLESSGNLLSNIHKLSRHPLENNTYYTLFNVRYAQYIRSSINYILYMLNNKLATRFFLGVGVPYGNSSSLPFEKSYSAGGANSMRAWNSSSLGPGGSDESEILLFNQVGDLKIEANIEYRFSIYKYLKGAIFTDIGNIWLLKEDIKRPKAEFKSSRFIQELAVGSGFGLRLDFDFFVIRLDAAIPIKNPQGPSDLTFTGSLNNLKLNIGIGYPF